MTNRIPRTDARKEDSTPNPLLLRPQAAAKILSVSPKTLWLLTEPRDPIRTVRLGKLVRYTPDDLQAFIDQQRQTA